MSSNLNIFEEQESGFEFDSTSGTPGLPLKKFGVIDVLGWDIPNLFAIDSENKVWGAFSGHRYILYPSDVKELISELKHGYCGISVNEILDVLGLPHEIPEWVNIARVHGWIPPDGWDDLKYAE
jgi:hypothetical protein